MNSVFVTLYYGGGWEFQHNMWNFVGEVSSKPIVVESSCTIDELKHNVVTQFGLGVNHSEIILSYKNPFNPSLKPFDVNTIRDLDTFIHINGLQQFMWSVPLCVNKVDGHNDSDQISREDPNVANNQNCPVHFDDNNGCRTEQTCDAGNQLALCIPTSNVDACVPEECIGNDTLAVVPHSTTYVPFGHDFELVVGKTYRSKVELKNALCLHSISDCSQYKIVKSKRKAVAARCIDEDCKWRVCFTKLGEASYFTTTKFVSTHTCSYHQRRSTNRGATYQVIAEKVKSMYGNSKRLPSVNQIVTVMKSLHSIDASYWKCWKAQEAVKDMIRGTSEDNYSSIPSYLYMLESVNKGTFASLILDDDKRFKYVFVAFGQSIRGFEAMRKVITVDGTHLSGKYGGVLLVATAQDANHQIYPIAFGIVDSENDASWDFFFMNLSRIIPDHNELVFVSDRHNSIRKGIASHYQVAFHGYCIWHLKGNLRKRTRSSRILQLFIDGAKRCRETDCLEILRQISLEKKKVGDLLTEIGIPTWSRSLCPAKRYNIMTSNNAECVNAILKEGREYPVLAMLDEIRTFMSRWFAERRQKSQACVEIASPKIESIIQKRFDESGSYFVYVLDANRLEFEVRSGDENVVVCLRMRTCACKEFDVEEIPCVHAVAAAKHVGMSPSYLASKYYSTEYWRAAYSEVIYPVPNKSEWVLPESVSSIVCEPPLKRKRCGRMPKARLRASWEHKSKRKCSSCGLGRHTKKTCVNQPK